MCVCVHVGLCTCQCICAGVCTDVMHGCICAQTSAHVVLSGSLLIHSHFMPSSSHLMVLKGGGRPGHPHPGTGLESSLPWSSENKRPCPLLTLASIPSIRSMPSLATPGPGCLLGTSEFSLPETNVCRLHSWWSPSLTESPPLLPPSVRAPLPFGWKLDWRLLSRKAQLATLPSCPCFKVREKNASQFHV